MTPVFTKSNEKRKNDMKKTVLKFVQLFLSVLFIASIASIVLNAAELPEKFTATVEVPDGYIGIYTADDLNITNMKGKYILMADIDVENDVISPIGTESAPFKGVFNGNGHTIKNIKFDDTNNSSALFAVVSGGVIKNLIVEDAVASVTSESSDAAYSAVIAAKITDGALIDNCYVSGSVTADSVGVPYAGGVVAYVDSSNVSSCVSTVTVNAKTYDKKEAFAGGVAAFAHGYSKISFSSFNGALGGTSYTLSLGGIAGGTSRSDNALPSVIACVNNADISASYTKSEASIHIGGIVAEAQNAYIAHSTNNGDLSATATLGSIVGGIAANHSRNTVLACANNGNITAVSTDKDAICGGIAAVSTYAFYIDSYNTGNIEVEGVSSAISGGICGQSKVGNDFSTCYSAGTNTSDISSDSGMFAGRSSFDDTYTNVYALASDKYDNFGLTEYNYTVTSLSASEMTDSSNFEGFDFDNTWIMPEDGDYLYPILMSINSELYGDVDGDGYVDATDSVILARYLAGWNTYSNIEIPDTCDLDSNDVIDSLDLIILVRHLSDFRGYAILPIEG